MRLWKRDYEPSRYMMVDLSKEKVSLYLIHFIMVQLLYGQSYLSDVSETIFVYTTVTVGSIPPDHFN